jgi:hypothetical protein
MIGPVRKCFAAMALLMIASCAPNPIVLSYTDYDTGYSPGEQNGMGPVHLVVRGSPLPSLMPEHTALTVRDAMQNEGFAPIEFTLDATPNSPYAAYVLFDPPRSLDDAAVCAMGPDQLPVAVPQGQLTVLAVLCRGHLMLSGTWGRLPAPTGATDPGFRGSIAGIVRALVPGHNLSTDGGNGH